MAIKYNREERNTSFFITFTCVKWIELIEESNSYQAFYKWFRYLQTIDVKVLSYVIMPNHFHAIFHIPVNCPKL
jgi:REP element-mobilizing transposase RayT